MNVQRDPDAILAAWLEEGPTGLPEPTRRAIAVNTRTTNQRRHPRWMPQRNPTMSASAPIAVAAVAAVLVVAVGSALYVIGSRPGPGTTPTRSVLSTPTGSASSPTTPASLRFTSPQYGYSVQMPPTWTVVPATAPWPGGFQIGEDPAYADLFLAQGSAGGASVSVKAQAIATGTTAAIWLADWEHAYEVGGHCFGSATPWTDASVAGIPARRLEWRCDAAQDAKSNYDLYSFVSGSTGYVISGTPSVVEVAVQSFQAP